MKPRLCIAKVDDEQTCTLHFGHEDGSFTVEVSREVFNNVRVSATIELPDQFDSATAGARLRWDW